MTGGFYLLQGTRLVELSETAYAPDDLLQDLLARYPNRLAGDQLDPSEPRRWPLIAWKRRWVYRRAR